MAVPTSFAVQVLTSTPTLLFTLKPYACRITIYNGGIYDIYLGDSSVTPGTGLHVAPQRYFSFSNNGNGCVYAITDFGDQTSPSDTRVFIEPTN